MSTPSREDVALTDDEREALGFQTPGSGGILAERIEAIVAAREAAARDAGARAVAATRWRCPVHGIPDCSPLLNGCSIPNHIANAVERAVSDLRTESAPEAEVERLRAERDDARENSRQMVADRNICHKAELAWMRRAEDAEAARDQVVAAVETVQREAGARFDALDRRIERYGDTDLIDRGERAALAWVLGLLDTAAVREAVEQ